MSLKATIAEYYRDRKNPLRLIIYLMRYVVRRGPQAARRRLETRRSIAKLARQQIVAEGTISIGIMTTGAIGDQIIAARFLRDLVAHCEDKLSFDIYAPKVSASEWVFCNVPNVNGVFQDSALSRTSRKYDMVWEVTSNLKVINVNSQFRASSATALLNVQENMQRFFDENSKLSDNRIAQELVYIQNRTRATSLHFIARIDYGGDRFDLPADGNIIGRLGLIPQSFITIHNGFDTTEVIHSGGSTKTYPYFADVIKIMRRAVPEFKFVQLGAATSVPIDGVDFNLISKTSLAEAAGLIKDAAIHIDNESGLVHMASCFGTRACVVYGPTNPDFFQYPGNGQVRPKACGGCWWITKDWLSRCPRGSEQPICMHGQPPENVAETALGLLGGGSPNSDRSITRISA
jgi:ADP-heptose:LPS heptosyltransferase